MLTGKSIILLSLPLALMAPAPLAAETIHLKNGRTIVADSAREVNGRIEYQIGEDTYAISKSIVARVDSASVPLKRSTSDFAIPEIVGTAPGTELLPQGIIQNGKVDLDELAAVERSGDAELIAAAYFVAGAFERNRGDHDKAKTYLLRALGFQPNDPILLVHYAAVLLELHRSSEAISYAERATRAAPNSADAFKLLGFAYFSSDRTADAIRAWKKSLELQPDPVVQSYLDKAQREKSAESEFSQTDTGRFSLRFEGRQSSASLRRDILRTLDAHYDSLVGDLGHAPRDSISVSLYTNQAFFDVTHAPAWSAAVNDGKLRIPVDGLDSMTAELSRVLKHELAHSFINQITRGRCPQWLNEGVAQIVEPRSSARNGRRLAELYGGQHQLPLNVLEGNWMRFTDNEAMLAYHESLAAVEYIRDTYGMSDVQRILQRLGQGSSTEAALRATIHAGYAEMEVEVGQYLKRTYGD